jgi:hypothetical protein
LIDHDLGNEQVLVTRVLTIPDCSSKHIRIALRDVLFYGYKSANIIWISAAFLLFLYSLERRRNKEGEGARGQL